MAVDRWNAATTQTHFQRRAAALIIVKPRDRVPAIHLHDTGETA
ncbi:hypothetical protein [Candidatus Rariloculus sp.]